MMNKKLSAAAAASLLLLVLAGCGDKPAAGPDNGGNSSLSSGAEGSSTAAPAASASPTAPPVETEAPSPEPVSSPAATVQPSASPEHTPAGQQETAKKSQEINVYFTDSQIMELKPGKAEIEFSNDIEKYKAAFKALQAGKGDELLSLWDKIELLSVDFKDGNVILDVHKPQEAQLGAGGESFAISALTQTMFQFAEVQGVELLVDGAQAETLMGHVELMYPFTRDNQ